MVGFKKYVKKQVKRAGKFLKKRYVKKGGPNMKNIVADVRLLKSLVNVEKKYTTVRIGPNDFAQNNAGLTGAVCMDITPVIAQGNTNSERSGNSLKLVSGCMDIQFTQMPNAINEIKIRYALIVVPDNSLNLSTSSCLSQFYEPSIFSSVIDYHSNRDPEFFQAFKVIKQGTCTLLQDAISTGQAYKQLKIPLRFNHHLKYNTNASTITTKNKFFLICTADTGNTTASTGASLNLGMKWFYTDN